MRITLFTITQDGQYIGKTSIMEQAVNAARTRAVETSKPVSVVAHLDDGRDREVIFNPDGTNERIWAIDRGQPLEPVVGQIYTNRGGGKYRCLARNVDGRNHYWNAGGVSSDAAGVFQDIESGWTFTAKGIIQYIDGTIEWDHSVDGTFKELTAH